MGAHEKILILDGIAGIPLGREICQTFVELGVDAAHVDLLQQGKRPFHGPLSALAKAWNRRQDSDSFYLLPKLPEAELRRRIAEEKPNILLVIGFIYKFYDPRRLQALAREFGIKLYLYDTDSCNLYARRREFVFFVEHELPVYDRIFSFSQVATRFFRDTLKLDAEHLPFGALPIKVDATEKCHEALFVGSCDLRRVFLLEAIRDHVLIRGNRWRRHFPLISEALRQRIDDRPVWGEALFSLLGSSRIVINVTRSDFFGTETGVNLRIFEALAAGAFLLTDHVPEVAELFKAGEEIEIYRSSEELAEKVAYYLAHDEERERIARQGHQAFLDRHSWQQRIAKQMLPRMR